MTNQKVAFPGVDLYNRLSGAWERGKQAAYPALMLALIIPVFHVLLATCDVRTAG